MILVDLSHSSHSSSQSGIQKVARGLNHALDRIAPAQAIVYDPYAKRFRAVDENEQKMLQPDSAAIPGKKRGAYWSQGQKLRGYWQRVKPSRESIYDQPANVILAPEMFGKHIPLDAYLSLAENTGATLRAVFHDMLALKRPDLSAAKTVAYYPEYLKRLGQFEAIAAVSEASRQDLINHWNTSLDHDAPPVEVIPPGIDLPQNTEAASPPLARPKILCVGTIEGRKNHLALLEAADLLWKEGLDFELQLIGASNAESAGPALSKIETLQNNGKPLSWNGAASQALLEHAYRECSFTIYPSLMEGFGLPALESLSYGKPCICDPSGSPAIASSTGGCFLPESINAKGLAKAMKSLLSNSELCETLCRQARQRAFRSWDDYAKDILAWLETPLP